MKRRAPQKFPFGFHIVGLIAVEESLEGGLAGLVPMILPVTITYSQKTGQKFERGWRGDKHRIIQSLRRKLGELEEAETV
jgi:hypothetical protein